MDARCFFLCSLLIAGTADRAAASPAVIPECRLGDIAPADVITPVHLIVIDHERTERLRQEEAQRTPAIYRLDPEAINEAEAALRVGVDVTRESFLDLLEANYAKR